MNLTDLLAPPALDFRPRGLGLGEAMGQALVVLDYPPRVGPAWLARLAALPGVCLSVHLEPTDPLALLTTLNRSAGEYAARMASGGSALAQSRWHQGMDDAKALLQAIDQQGQRVYRTVVVLLVVATDEAELARRVRLAEATCAASGMRARCAVYRQEDGLRASGPWAALPPEIAAMAARDMPAATVAAGYPWVSSGVNHGSGCVWGRDEAGGLVLLDRWSPPEGSGITNANVTVLGTSGGGKSFAAKVLLLREFALGVRVLVIDPEREYRGICAAVGGAWINAAGGQGRVNPLQVPAAAIADQPDPGVRGALAAHLQRLKTFFGLYLPGLSGLDRAALQSAFLDAYRAKGVHWTTDPRAVAQWPTVTDVYGRLKGHPRLALLLRDAAEGADAALWAGQSTLPPASDFTVLDVHDLTDASDNVRRAQYFNVLGYAWDLVRQGRATGQRTLLVVDETWLLADPQTPEALGFLRDVAKRIRKYGGSLAVITQNPVDFLAPEVARLGQPVLGNASTKLLVRQEPKDLEVLRDLLHLSEAECDLLAGARRGEGLLLAGNRRVHLRVEAAPAELALLGP